MSHCEGFQAIIGLSNNFHIRLTIDNLCHAFTKEFVIVNKEDASACCHLIHRFHNNLGIHLQNRNMGDHPCTRAGCRFD